MVANCMPSIASDNRVGAARRQNTPASGRKRRIVMLAVLIALAPMVSGCADFDADKLDIFHLNDKKKLPGEREPVFPNGVPGVTQGIPQEYMKGSEQEQAGAAVPIPSVDPAATAAEKPTAQSEPKPAAKPKPKRVAKRKPKPKPPAEATAKPAAQQPAAASTAWPAPAQTNSNTTSQPAAPWPASPPPGTFTR